jgi:hypothetical protein
MAEARCGSLVDANRRKAAMSTVWRVGVALDQIASNVGQRVRTELPVGVEVGEG